ncbi:hypothetical protein CYCD_28680 [Tenuifilaceae bacterium CYCD]|nr:hypothetical protein CYCD_28680 [Tenuifilaceae bacterium CYCD]
MLRASRIDTIEKSSNLIAIMGFDADNRVVRKESQFYSKELDLKWSQVELFNSKGNIVLEINEGIIPCRHSFEYDNQNRLIVEKFFAFGTEEKKIEYKYDNKGKLLEKVES